MTRFRFMMLFILLLIPTSAIGELMPLHEAARKGDVEEVKRLLDNGADVWAQDMGTTALYWAAFDHVEVVKVLLEHGANVWAKGTDGWTALHNAAFRGRGDIVTVLLEHGADVGARDEDGKTALFYAAQNGNVDVVKVLVEHGADVEAKDKDGWTALHRAAWKGRGAVVKVLLEHGADVWARDKEGRTPRDVAYREDMIRLLDQADGHQPPATRKETP